MERGVPYRRGMKGKTKFKAESSPIGERVTSHERISVPALISPFKKLVFTAMKIHSVSEKTFSASLTLIFATDTGIALSAPLIWVTQTVFFVVKTLRSVTEQHCFVTKQHCFVTEKSFCINEGARPTWETHCFISKQHCCPPLPKYSERPLRRRLCGVRQPAGAPVRFHSAFRQA